MVGKINKVTPSFELSVGFFVLSLVNYVIESIYNFTSFIAGLFVKLASKREFFSGYIGTKQNVLPTKYTIT